MMNGFSLIQSVPAAKNVRPEIPIYAGGMEWEVLWGKEKKTNVEMNRPTLPGFLRINNRQFMPLIEF